MTGSPFFTMVDSLQARFDRVGRALGLQATTATELARWQPTVRAHLRRITGIDTMEPAPLAARLTESVNGEGYRRERVVIQTEPGIMMPLYVLVPADLDPTERRACVIAPHGHGSGGKLAVAGRRDIPAVAATISQHNYDYGVQLARQGFIVFCPDARGFGERREQARQSETDMLGGSCSLLNHMAIPLGQTVTGMWTWDLMRLIDYVATRPDCDVDRLGCAGLSGGGLQTLWLAALDERVRCSVVSGYFYGCKESLLVLNGNCSCNYVPGLWQAVDMGDLAALIAPRPLLIETGSQDSLNGPNGLRNVYSQIEIVRRAYQLHSLDYPKHDVFEGGHRWNGVEAIPFLRARLGV